MNLVNKSKTLVKKGLNFDFPYCVILTGEKCLFLYLLVKYVKIYAGQCTVHAADYPVICVPRKYGSVRDSVYCASAVWAMYQVGT